MRSKTEQKIEHLPRLKHPVAAPVFIHLVPPAQTHHQPPRDVLLNTRHWAPSVGAEQTFPRAERLKTRLHGPEVAGEQEDYRHHAGDEASAEEVTEQVREDGADSEEQVEEGGHRMSANMGNKTPMSCFQTD